MRRFAKIAFVRLRPDCLPADILKQGIEKFLRGCVMPVLACCPKPTESLKNARVYQLNQAGSLLATAVKGHTQLPQKVFPTEP